MGVPPSNQVNPSQTPPVASGGAVSAMPAQAAATPNQAAQKTKTQQNVASTQNSLLLSELRDSMVVMSDGTFRAIVACKSINFDLMSERERGGVETNYQDFLNALRFPIQKELISVRTLINSNSCGAIKTTCCLAY